MLAFFFVGISYALVIILIYSYFFTSPKEKRLIRELDATEIKINSLEKKINILSNVLQGMEQKDDNLYRVLLEAEPLKNRNSSLENQKE